MLSWPTNLIEESFLFHQDMLHHQSYGLLKPKGRYCNRNIRLVNKSRTNGGLSKPGSLQPRIRSDSKQQRFKQALGEGKGLKVEQRQNLQIAGWWPCLTADDPGFVCVCTKVSIVLVYVQGPVEKLQEATVHCSRLFPFPSRQILTFCHAPTDAQVTRVVTLPEFWTLLV